ncbi:hypothetical protein WJX73_010845, partial [Symbiochloris irregularis]
PAAGAAGDNLGSAPVSPDKAGAQQHQQSAAPEKRTLQEWVDALVRHISEAQGVEDARARASQVLQAFQHALALAHRKEADDVMRDRLGELTRENGILKRAVAIQAQRIQGASSSSAHENMRLRSQVAEYEAKLHSLELSNFSLAMHLKAATGSAGIGLANGRPPDVF